MEEFKIEIAKGSERKPEIPIILVYGEPGIGKTSFAATFPNPFFVQTENGFGDKIKADSLKKPVDNYKYLVEALEYFARTSHEYKTIVVDHLGGVETLIYDAILRREGGSMFAPHKDTTMITACKGYGNAYKEALKYWRGQFWQAVKKLQEKRIFVVLIAHRGLTTVKDPLNGDYATYAPELREDVVAFLVKETDVILYATRRNEAQGDSDGNPRVLKCCPTRYYFAKTRYGKKFNECGLTFEDFAKKIGYPVKQ